MFLRSASVVGVLSLVACSGEEPVAPGPERSCTGVSAACGVFEDAGGCLTHRGCAYGEYCSGDLQPCESATSEASCGDLGGCAWSMVQCTSSEFGCRIYRNNEAVCIAPTSSCSYDPTPYCDINSRACGELDEAACVAPDSRCRWDATRQSCGIVEGACDGEAEERCDALVGCRWAPSCSSNADDTCAAFETFDACINEHAGCGWSYNPNPSCAPERERSCDALTLAECANGELGCGVVNGCYGTPSPCEAIETEISCVVQAGCLWQ